MTVPIKVDTTTTPDSIKQMTTSEQDYSVHKILESFVSSDTGVATLSINPGSTVGLTSIGTFADTYTDPVGTHPTTTVYTTNYTFYQDLQSASETSLIRPLKVDTSTTPDSLREQSDSDLNSTIISRALANLVSQGIGSYYLGSSAPAGGTWVAKATITGSTDTSTSTAVYLWRKTAAASIPSTVLPVKVDKSTTPDSLKQMTDVEIQTLTSRLRNQVVATGIGNYQLSASAPVSGGTWVSAGSITDIRRDFSTVAYTSGSFSGTYTGSFTGSYVGSFTGNYTGNFTGNYIGPTYYSGYSGTPNATYAGTYSRAFSGTYTRSFSGTYSGNFTGTYSGSYSGSTVQTTTSSISTLTLWVRTA